MNVKMVKEKEGRITAGRKINFERMSQGDRIGSL